MGKAVYPSYTASAGTLTARTLGTVCEDSAAVTSTLVSSGVEEKARVDSCIRRVLAAATVIELSAAGYAEALDLQDTRALSPQDAVVYASVLQHLRAVAEPSCFVTRNFKDFLTPDIESDLHGVRRVTRMHGLGRGAEPKPRCLSLVERAANQRSALPNFRAQELPLANGFPQRVEVDPGLGAT